jgi:hypothetical protein
MTLLKLKLLIIKFLSRYLYFSKFQVIAHLFRQRNRCDMVSFVKFLFSAAIMDHRVQISGKGYNAHPHLAYRVAVSAHSYAVNVVYLRVLLARDTASPRHHASVHIPLNILASIPQGIRAGDTVLHAKVDQIGEKFACRFSVNVRKGKILVFIVAAKRPLEIALYGIGHIAHPLRNISHRGVDFPPLIVGYAPPIVKAHLNGLCIVVKAPPLSIRAHLNGDNIVHGR